MGQEFVIKSTILEDKINQLLPSQGGAQAGVDLSASTTIIPIIDLTESAEGSGLRQDLQRSFSLNSITRHNIFNTTSTMVNTTGYYRVFGDVYVNGGGFAYINLTDGISSKIVLTVNAAASGQVGNEYFDFDIFLKAGQSLTGQTNSNNIVLTAITRQIADVNGNLTDPN